MSRENRCVCNSDIRGRIQEGGWPGGRVFLCREYLGKEEGISRRGFLFSGGLGAQKSPVFAWGSGGFVFRERGTGQGLRGPCMIELMGQAAAQAASFSEDFFAG